jgi:ribosomal protein S27AE
MSSNTNRDNVVINPNDSSVSYPPSAKLFCNKCNCNLVLLDASKEEWYCNRCSVTYFPNKGEKVRRANKFSTPEDNRDKIPPMALIDDSAVTNVSPRKSSFPKSMEFLKRPGVNITDFSSTVDNEGI